MDESDNATSMTADEFEAALDRIRLEAKRLRDCPLHAFTMPEGFTDLPIGIQANARWRCHHCAGWLSPAQARQYALGWAAGTGKSPNVVVPGMFAESPPAPRLARLWALVRALLRREE